MMAWLVDFSTRFRVLVLAAATAIIVFGSSRLETMAVDVLPEFSPPIVDIQTEAPGLSVNEVEVMVTAAVEELMSGLSWLKTLRSESVTGLSTVHLVFEPGTDVMRARQLVQERLLTAFLLPNVARPPEMLQPLSSTNRVMMIGLSSAAVDPIQLSVLTQWTVKPKLLGIPGIANVAVWGDRARQIQVQIDPVKLKESGLNQEQVVKSAGNSLWVSQLSYLNASAPGTGGWLDGPSQRLEIRHILPISTAADLAKIRIDGTDKRLGDVAKVVEGHPPLIGDAIVGEGQGLLLVIEKFPGANTLEVTRAVEAALESLRPALAGVDIKSDVFRPASFVEAAISNLSYGVLIGAGLLIFGLLIFRRGDWRILVIAAIALPVTYIAASLLLGGRGATMNSLIIAGFAVALLCVIDDVVVAFDAWRAPAGALGRAQPWRPIGYATLIAVIAVTPVFFLDGVWLTFLTPLVLAFIVTVLVSLVVTLTIPPAVFTQFFVTARHPADAAVSSLLDTSANAAMDIVKPRRRPIAGGIVVACMAAAVVLVLGSLPTIQRLLPPQLRLLPQLKLMTSAALLPRFNERDVVVRWEAQPGTSLREMDRILTKAATELRALPGIRGVSAHAGRAVSGDQIVSVNSAQIWIGIKASSDYDKAIAGIRDVVDSYPGVNHWLETYITDQAGADRSGASGKFVVRVYGTQFDELRGKAREVAKMLAAVDGLEAAKVEEEPNQPEVGITVDLAAVAQVGLKPGDVRREASTLFSGLEVGKIFEAQKVFDVVVWSTPDSRRNLSEVADSQIELTGGGHARLGDLAKISISATPTVIRRDGISLYLDAVADVGGRNYDAIVDDVESRLKTIAFPLGYHPKVLGALTALESSQDRMVIAMLVAAVAILLLMQSFFRSWGLAAAVFLALPLAVLGGVLTTAGAGLTAPLSVPTLFALAAIYALAARQAMMLIDQFQRLRSEPGGAFGPALVEQGVRARTLPVLTTAVCSALALAPALIFTGQPGFEFLQPMAVVMIAGLISSSVVVLLVLPALYLWFGANVQPEMNLAEMTLEGAP